MESLVRQGQIAKVIRGLCSDARDAESSRHEVAKQLTLIAGGYSWGLYRDIDCTTQKPIVSAEMEARRGVPSDPEYFESLDAIEEFLHCLGQLGTANHKES